MTMTTENQFAQIAEEAATAAGAVDCNVAQKGGFTKTPPRAGVALLRFKSYIETGTHKVKKGMGKGKIQPWADFGFELVHPDHLIGPDDAKFPDTININNVNVSMNEKAKYFKLFDAMNKAAGGMYTQFAQMLGKGFLAEIYHNEKDGTVYCNLDQDGAWSIRAPRYAADPIGAPDVITQIAVPELQSPQQCFLFDNPGVSAESIQAMWASIEITGEKSDGTAKKNWIQDKVRSALNFDGSFVQSVVGGSAIVEAEVADKIADATAAAIVDAADGANQIADTDQTLVSQVANVVADAAAVVDPLASIPGL